MNIHDCAVYLKEINTQLVRIADLLDHHLSHGTGSSDPDSLQEKMRKSLDSILRKQEEGKL